MEYPLTLSRGVRSGEAGIDDRQKNQMVNDGQGSLLCQSRGVTQTRSQQ